MRDYLAERLAREEVPEEGAGDWAELLAWSQGQWETTWPEEPVRRQEGAADWLEQEESPEKGTDLEDLETLAGRVSDLVAEKLAGTAPQMETETQTGGEGGALAELRRENGQAGDLSQSGSLWVTAESLTAGSGASPGLGQAEIAALDRAVEREARRYDGSYRLY